MLGDSFMDLGGAGPAIMTAAGNAMYRHYYLLGAAMTYGSGQGNIPYQFNTMALTDTLVTKPTDIKVIIMDGGGNDVLVNNRQCLTTSLAQDTNGACKMVVDTSNNTGNTLFKSMATHGVHDIVFYFYPHLDPNGGGLLPTPNTGNDWLDYAKPKIETGCCGSSFTSDINNYSCDGNGPGTHCVFVDTMPSFEGKLATYIGSDHVHPTAAGATQIATLVWGAMQKYCVAQ